MTFEERQTLDKRRDEWLLARKHAQIMHCMSASLRHWVSLSWHDTAGEKCALNAMADTPEQALRQLLDNPGVWR
jgi:hypothetical protein